MKNSTLNKRAVIRKILYRIRKYTPLLILTLLLAASSVALTLFIPKLIGSAVDLIIEKNNVDIEGILKILATVAVLAAISAVLQWIMSALNNRVAFNVVADLRTEAFEKIQHLPISYIDGRKYGDIVSCVISDADQFSDGLLIGFTQLFSGILTVAITLILMFTINPVIALITSVLTPLSLFISKFIATRTYKMFIEQTKARGEQTSFIEETITARKTVTAMNAEKQTSDSFDRINDRLSGISLKAIFYSSLTNPTTRFVNGIVYAAVACSGALTVILGGGLSVGGLTCFLSYANQYTKPFSEISGVIAELQGALACAQRLFELIEQPSEAPDKNNALLEKVNGKVEIKDVNFSYVKDRNLIKNFNLTVRPGQKIAVVGPTGCGKTTLINLLMRFYDVDSGEIRIDGVDICDIPRKTLRACYGMVLQETWLKNTTVKDNIRMGKPEATDDEIIAAAKAAHAHSFIKRMENGYDTVIGTGTGNLSEGQRQLLCIARVMLRNPPMLILDEATSSIDTRTELKIQNAFAELMNGRTSFIVAHRLSTIRDADVILVMKDGNIIEKGEHTELLSRKGFYYNLYNSQFEQPLQQN